MREEKGVYCLKKSVICVLAVALVFLLAGQVFAVTHVVRRGETLWQLSQRYRITLASLAQANQISNKSRILVGQHLVIPGQTASQSVAPVVIQPVAQQTVHTVRAGETLWRIALRYNITVGAVAAANSIANLNIINAGQRLIIPSSTATPTAAVVPIASRAGRNFSAAELDLFARLVYAEAAGESFEGQVAVAASVLNRVDSPLFPNTLTAVIFQVVSGFYQYSPVLDGRINLPANDSARRAVQEAINGRDPSLGATGFFNPAKTSNQWVRRQPVSVVIGNHVFFL